MNSYNIPRPNPDYLPGVNYRKINAPFNPPVRRDLKYPLTIRNGGLDTTTDNQILQEAILSVIETEKGERVMRQEYGLNNQLFQAVLGDVVDVEIKRSIEAQVTEIDEIVTRVNNDDLENGTLRMQIFWSTNGRSQVPVNLELSK
ncbi:MAG: hypothetical protein R3321_00335 [Nitrososphaeraceae archaeon]|nr:hypothetical protein [Nitrososphaeraceae archaeon]